MTFRLSKRNKVLVMLSLLLPSTSILAQSTDKNYIQTKTFLDDSGLTFLRHIDYYDDLGCVSETVDEGVNTMGTPLVVKTDYTSQLKPYRQWAAVPASGLDYIPDVRNVAASTYNDNRPYSISEYDDFQELSSICKPGVDWEGHEKVIVRDVAGTGSVRKYSVSSNGALTDEGAYPDGVLTSTTTTDEDGRVTTVYANLHGDIILERRDNSVDTYYVYDKYGRLCYVLPPMCQECDEYTMQKYWYRYTYDDRGRCIEKQLPGCDAIEYYYDDANRIQSVQDGRLRDSSVFRNYRYDSIGRLTLQTIEGSCGEATEGSAEIVEAKNFYDNDAFRSELASLFPEWADSINAVSIPTMEARGKLTAKLRSTSEAKHYCEIYSYDANGRMVYKLSAYDDKWMKITHTSYNFVGDVSSSCERIYTILRGNIALMVGRSVVNTYHPSTRLLMNTVYTCIDRNGNTYPQTINIPTYDSFGNVTNNNRPGTAADITYTYDTLHGWLKGISSPSGFNENILRETAATPQYSGNIGSMLWSNTTNGEQHRYDFEYDRLGRLTDSMYSSSANGTEGRFDESVTYNCQGSMISLRRNGMKNDGTIGLIDDLSINYDGNHLLNVTDEADPLYYDNAQDFKDGTDMTTEYEYDNMGALVRDRNRVINNITYDLAGNPMRINIDNGLGEIENDYTSDGVKLYSHHITRFTVGSLYCITTTDMYVDGLIMRNNSPMMWRYDGGYVSLNYTGTPSIWNFYVNDHIGSTRMVVDSNNQVKDVINYYPYGGEITMKNPTLPPAYVNRQPFRFSGKELDNINGLRMYDFGARWYDVAGVPMWTSIDPLAEDNYSVTPYSYCNGDPVNRIDPDGMEDYIINKNGQMYESPSWWYKIKSFLGLVGDNDRIFTEGTDDLLITLPNGSIENLQVTENKKSYSFEISDRNVAEEAYNAIRNYTDVEWANIQHGSSRSTTFVTDCTADEISSAVTYLYKYEKEGNVIMTHNHVPLPDDVNNPGVYFNQENRRKPSTSDIKTAAAHPKVVFRQTYKGEKIINYYNGKGVYKVVR